MPKKTKRKPKKPRQITSRRVNFSTNEMMVYRALAERYGYTAEQIAQLHGCRASTIRKIALKRQWQKPHYTRVMACDPGVNNFGLFVGDFIVINGELKVRVLENRLLKNPIHDIKDKAIFLQQVAAYNDELSKVIDKYQPDMYVTERFQNRGFTKGLNPELVPMMNTYLLDQASKRGKECRWIIASQWKLAFERQVGAKVADYYGDTPPHLIDSQLIALYEFEAENKWSKWAKERKKALRTRSK